MFAVLLGADEVMKQYVEDYMEPGEERRIAGGKLLLRRIHNPGFALGTLEDQPKIVRNVSVAAAVPVFAWWLSLIWRKGHWIEKTGSTLAAAGAAGVGSTAGAAAGTGTGRTGAAAASAGAGTATGVGAAAAAAAGRTSIAGAPDAGAGIAGIIGTCHIQSKPPIQWFAPSYSAGGKSVRDFLPGKNKGTGNRTGKAGAGLYCRRRSRAGEGGE